MAYEVTSTRKRPKDFDELYGQEFVSATLKNSIKCGRIAQAYLFSGPRGCGKTSTARILSKALNCERGPTMSPCGTCPSCQSITKGSSLDVIEIDGASNTSVDNVRQIKEEVLFPPSSGKYKIYIIDEVHMLSTSAFNALLKTIEEPPPYIIFIFATTEIHKVPATIKSRCQQFNFRLIPAETTKKLLTEACAESGVKAEDEALSWIAKESTGSMRDAYTLLDQAISFSEGDLTMTKIKEKLGLVGMDEANAIAEACAAGKTGEALRLADDTLGKGTSIDQFVSDLADYYRALLLVKNGIRRETILGSQAERYSAAVLGSLGTPQIERCLSVILELARNLRLSPSPRYELELAVARLSGVMRYLSPGEIADEIRSMRKALALGATIAAEDLEGEIQSPSPDSPQAPQTDAPSAGDSDEYAGGEGEGEIGDYPDQPRGGGPESSQGGMDGASVTSETAEELKKAVITQFRKTRAVLASRLEKAVEWRIDGSEVTITVRAHYDADMLREHIPIIAPKINAALGRNVRVEIKAEAPLRKAEPQASPEAGEGEDETDPVQIVEKVFRGKVVAEKAPRGEE